MNQFQRFYRLHTLLKSRRLPISCVVLEKELEASKATVKRMIVELRNYGAPIEYSRERNGYFYAPNTAFELPGVWFAVERVREARVSTTPAKEVRDRELHGHFATAYGIFAGQPIATARLVFTAHRGRGLKHHMVMLRPLGL